MIGVMLVCVCAVLALGLGLGLGLPQASSPAPTLAVGVAVRLSNVSYVALPFGAGMRCDIARFASAPITKVQLVAWEEASGVRVPVFPADPLNTVSCNDATGAISGARLLLAAREGVVAVNFTVEVPVAAANATAQVIAHVTPSNWTATIASAAKNPYMLLGSGPGGAAQFAGPQVDFLYDARLAALGTEPVVATLSATRSAMSTSTSSATATATRTASAMSTATATSTAMATAMASSTAMATATGASSTTTTSTSMSTATATATSTLTASPTPTTSTTLTVSATPSGTASSTPSGTPSGTPSATETGTVSATPSGTPSNTPSATQTASVSPTAAGGGGVAGTCAQNGFTCDNSGGCMDPTFVVSVRCTGSMPDAGNPMKHENACHCYCGSTTTSTDGNFMACSDQGCSGAAGGSPCS
jgi:hypothetical protein